MGLHLPDHLLDRLIRNPPTRVWIGLVAFALIGIVAMQLWVVKLGAGIGRALEHAALLQRENTTLAIEDSALSSGERVERLAGARGMVPAPASALRFDTLRGPLDTSLAAAALTRPIQTQATSPAPVGSGGATGTEASAPTAAAPAAGAGTAATPETGAGTAAETGAGTGATTATGAGSPASTETGANAAASTETGAPAAETPAARGPASEEPASGAAATPAAVAPAATGGATEAAGPPVGSSGGVQTPAGG